MQVFFYDVHKLAIQLEDIVSVMSPHFSSKPGTYYSDALFFLSLGLHRIAPSDQKLAAMFDADTKFRRDVKGLFKEFNNFGEKALFGLAPELTPVYRHVLYLYRNKHPNTPFGEPRHKGGYPGYNSGMVLFNLERLRKSRAYNEIVGKESVDAMTEKYHFKVNKDKNEFLIRVSCILPLIMIKWKLICIVAGPLGRSRFLYASWYGAAGAYPYGRLWLEQATLYLVA